MNGKGKDRALAQVGLVSSGSFNGMQLVFLPSLAGRGGGKQTFFNMLEMCQLEMRLTSLGVDGESHPRPAGDGQHGSGGGDGIIFTNSGLGVRGSLVVWLDFCKRLILADGEVSLCEPHEVQHGQYKVLSLGWVENRLSPALGEGPGDTGGWHIGCDLAMSAGSPESQPGLFPQDQIWHVEGGGSALLR